MVETRQQYVERMKHMRRLRLLAQELRSKPNKN